ncbi:hypothetical protein [Mesomycoplasma bovoculi]|uniref:Uncharacterized protein n=1 Tax=Mesomycoplasma bovoculi M165/69 TaxID=743966 RepID=W5V0F1_9BACT|nr:hypothetical protein [Mesomycoplasma bovoculi]AHH45278.1 hypothetical protein MYB_01340 [Mesomycoplasma bovoculi M165/69]
MIQFRLKPKYLFILTSVLFLVAIVEACLYFYYFKENNLPTFVTQITSNVLILLVIITVPLVPKFAKLWYQNSFWTDWKFTRDICGVKAKINKINLILALTIYLLILGFSVYFIFILKHHYFLFSQLVAFGLLVISLYYKWTYVCAKFGK